MTFFIGMLGQLGLLYETLLKIMHILSDSYGHLSARFTNVSSATFTRDAVDACVLS
jgi:uncharacterized membrane protein YccF (DUF307 family)